MTTPPRPGARQPGPPGPGTTQPAPARPGATQASPPRPAPAHPHAARPGPRGPGTTQPSSLGPGATRAAPAGKVWFVGAGPGAADLVTLRGARVIAEADVVVWAASLVRAEVVAGARGERLDSSRLTLEEVCAVYDRAAAEGLRVARVHSGDPSLYGAIGEQIAHCDRVGLDWEIVPGVSSLAAAAAAAGRELTVPEVGQSVIITRLPTATPMPPGEQVRAFARHGTTMALFLSAKRGRRLQEELLAGGYPPETPCLVAYRVTWPEELLAWCRLDELARTLREARLHKHTLILVGPALAAAGTAGGTRSHLYDPAFAHEFRAART
jgi:precorrin-4/cobalt-precorrin-4 C11-methyltransferase